MKKKFLAFLILVLLCWAGYYWGVGFFPRTEIALVDFQVSPQADRMELNVAVVGSAGYLRTAKNVSDDPEIIKLKFYSAFGGFNGSIGAKNTFNVPLNPESKEIYILKGDDFDLVLVKNGSTGQWEEAV